MKIIVVGAGILGTWIAIHLIEQGHSVVHLERDSEPQGASIRNLGLIWISGRGAGAELDTALAARDRWLSQKARWPELPLRTDGSITLAATESEVDALEAANELADARRRGFTLLKHDELSSRYGIQAPTQRALFCSMDAITEPRSVLSVLRGRLSQHPSYQLRTNAEVIYCDDEELELIDHTRIPFDYAFFATGVSDLRSIGFDASTSRLTRTQLQMLQTAPHDRLIPPAIADIDSFRYYPAFASVRSLLGPQDPIAASHGAQLLVSQRSDGSLTVGDTHDEYGSPFLGAAIEDHLVRRARSLLGHDLGGTTHRWQGVYSKLVPGDESLYFSERPRPNVTWITGLGGRGMTISPQASYEAIEEAIR
jgi:FAD dependent oxidoreductase TIGR03364